MIWVMLLLTARQKMWHEHRFTRKETTMMLSLEMFKEPPAGRGKLRTEMLTSMFVKYLTVSSNYFEFLIRKWQRQEVSGAVRMKHVSRLGQQTCGQRFLSRTSAVMMDSYLRASGIRPLIERVREILFWEHHLANERNKWEKKLFTTESF